jgi:DNA polymerase-3 subunit epsilon
MKRILILDTETTGLDPTRDACIEVAAVLFDLEHASTIESYASLIRASANPAEAINAIPAALLDSAPPADDVWPRVEALARRADAIVAHRAEFDRGFVHASVRDSAPWVCSKFDLEWPKSTRVGDGLVSLALSHGLGVANAHRAMTDCDTLARLFMRVHEMGVDLPRMIARGMRPKVRVVALVSYDDRDKAKSAGFSWDPSRKEWARTIFQDEIASLPFRVREASAS